MTRQAAQEIATAAIRSRVDAGTWTPRGKPQWTPAEDAQLGTIPDGALVVTLGRSRGSIVARRHKLGVSSLQVLSIIQSGPSTLGQIARDLGLTTAAVTGIADRLAALSFATRVRSKANRRQIHLKITFHGIATLDAILHPEPAPV